MSCGGPAKLPTTVNLARAGRSAEGSPRGAERGTRNGGLWGGWSD